VAVDVADIPETFFVFVNLLNPMTAHNARLVGSLTSSAWTSAVEDDAFREKYLSGNVDYLPFIPNPSSDQKFVSSYYAGATSDYTNEYNAELTRRAEFPTLPSRLSATYAFGDYATCETVAKKHDWSLSEVEEFQLVSGRPLTRVATVNMEIVSLMSEATRISMLTPDTISGVWRHYWSGGGSLPMELPGADFKRHVIDSGEIWEYLIEGRLDRVGGPIGTGTQPSS
jgi:hypothetical protein